MFFVVLAIDFIAARSASGENRIANANTEQATTHNPISKNI